MLLTERKLISDLMLQKIKKYSIAALIVIISTIGTYQYVQKRSYEKKIAELYNDLAKEKDTVEVQKNLYKKATMQIEDMDQLIKSLKGENDTDKKALVALRAEIKKLNEELLTANRLIIKWKKAYEAEAAAHQSTDTGTDPDDQSDDRIRIDFDHDFGYIGVNGYTLTNPAYAWVSVKQNKPLYLTVAVTQSKDKSWSTYVTSSEENLQVDVILSAVNPYIFNKKWYEKISLDVSIDFASSLDAYAGVSYPFGPITMSGGIWGNQDDVSPYLGMSYSWKPFER